MLAKETEIMRSKIRVRNLIKSESLMLYERAYFSRYHTIGPESPHLERFRVTRLVKQKPPTRAFELCGVLLVHQISGGATHNEC